MEPQYCAKPSGRYYGRIYSFPLKTANGIVDIHSATVIYVDEHGAEHATGYDHPRIRSPRSVPWSFRRFDRPGYQHDVNLIARDYQRYLQKTGNRFELAHPSWWAPGIEKQPPYWADDDDESDLLAA